MATNEQLDTIRERIIDTEGSGLNIQGLVSLLAEMQNQIDCNSQDHIRKNY